MRILMLVGDFPPTVFGGIGIYAGSMADELIRLGHEVDVFVLPVSNAQITKDYTTDTKCDGRGVLHVYRFRTKELESEWACLHGGTRYNLLWAYTNSVAMPAVMNKAMERQYEVIHTHDFFGAPVADAIREVLGVPIVNTVHASGYEAQALSFQLRKYICLIADRNMIASKFLRKAISLDPQLEKMRYDTVYAGVHLREESMNEVSKDNHDILMVGMVKQTKGCFMMLKAYLSLMRNREIPADSRLLYAGTGEDLEQLIEYVRENDLDKQVVCFGPLANAEVRNIMHHSCVLAALGQEEAFGLTALEALAENTPVIASNFGGFPEYLTDEKDSLLVDPFSVTAIKEAVKRILNDETLQMKLIENGAATARKWSWARTARASEWVYRDTIEEWEANGKQKLCYQKELQKQKTDFDLRGFMEKENES